MLSDKQQTNVSIPFSVILTLPQSLGFFSSIQKHNVFLLGDCFLSLCGIQPLGNADFKKTSSSNQIFCLFLSKIHSSTFKP